MKLTKLSTDAKCPDGVNCPAVYATNRDTLVVRGYRLQRSVLESLDLPDHEDAIEIPLTLIKEAGL